MNTTGIDALPDFLSSFENLTEHFTAHFDALDSNARGDRFLDLTQRIVPFTDAGAAFPPPDPNPKKSHDKGVDLLTAEGPDGEKLCVQSKFKLTSKDEFDTIVSKFKDYESGICLLRPLFPESDQTPQKPTYMIVTSSKLAGIIAAYEKSELASKHFYQSLRTDNRLAIVDGPRILLTLQTLYRKAFILPSTLELKSVKNWLNIGNVYIGVLKGRDIASLYDSHGDALFFENIRDFLGLTSGKKETEGRETVNSKIMDTIRTEAPRMLERNNGITFRAESVSVLSDDNLRLQGAAIVNGCQTTMCLWHSRESMENACHVVVKVVVTNDAWDVAKAANYQNAVAQIDLDLARYLRPQLIQRAATDQGYGTASTKEESIIGVLDTIHAKKVEYEEMKCLYLGLFSRKPNNLFADNYAELRTDVLEGLYKHGSADEERIFATVFLIVTKSHDSLDICSQAFDGHEYERFFKRFHNPEKPRYRAYLAILALSGALEDNLAKRSTDKDAEVARMEEFLSRARSLLENEQTRFNRCYLNAYEILASTALQAWKDGGNESHVAQEMHKKVSQSPFDTLYLQLRMRIDADKRTHDALIDS